MQFTKMHGCGNDYVYHIGEVPDAPALARKVSDRHFGIGSDGLILVLPPTTPDAHVRMRMFNADGSESEMCGNGVRCVAKLAYDRNVARQNPLRVETGRGVLAIELTLADDGTVAQATVDMGEPILVPADIPLMIDAERAVNVPIDKLTSLKMAVPGLQPTFTAVSMGNPHIVLYCDDVDAIPLHVVGPILENDPLFPRRTNVHFVQVISLTEAKVLHWERGSGATLACGTGACAVCVAGVLTGKTDRELLTHLPGGDLTLRWDHATDHVFMTGEAVEVFTGEWRE